MRSVAVLSDVHGVAPALEAVLAEPDVRAVDLVVVAGDHASGPMPVQTLDLLAGLGERALLVRGNADTELLEVLAGGECPYPEAVWAAGQLEPRHVELLAALPHPASVEVDGFGRVLVCHGSPRDEGEVLLVDTRAERWVEALADVPVDVGAVVCGHTHMPFVRLVDGRLVVDPGSVGMPYGTPPGCWALLAGGQVSLRRAPLDADAVAREVLEHSTYPGVREWVGEYLREPHGDLEALEAFAPRDGRDR